MKPDESYCGLNCRDCPLFLLKFETDEAEKLKMIKEIISACQYHYGITYKYEDIIGCCGCKAAEENLFTGCRNCAVRICASGRNIDNCGYCPDYPCQSLTDIFKTDPEAKIRLDKIRHLN